MTDTSRDRRRAPLPMAPSACTLPSTEQPMRVQEFDDLLARDVFEVTRVGADRASLDLRDRPGLVADVYDLARRESQCCSFFDFAISPGPRGPRLTIGVPPEHADVLAALVERARRRPRPNGAPTP